MTLGHFAPEGATGVADYARTLHSALAREGRIAWSGRDAKVRLYHVGNNGLHRGIYEEALRRPGLAILHDAVLHHFFLGGTETDYVEEFVYNYGEWHRDTAAGLWRNRARSAGEAAYFRHAMVRRIAETALAVAVHNRRAARIVLEHAPKARVEVVPHLAEASRSGERTSLPRPGTWFGVFGYLRPAKRVSAILRAASRVPGVRVLVSGSFIGDDFARTVSRPGNALFLPHASDAEFEARLRAVDAVVSLHSPSAGETSGITVRAMAAGRPVLVNSRGEAEDFPAGLCAPVEEGPAEAASLEAMMHWLTRYADDGASMGAAAREHVQREHSPERIARRLWDIARSLCLVLLTFLPALLCPLDAAPLAVRIPMRDGVKLLAHVYLPPAAGPPNGGRFPVLLLRTPYGRTDQPSQNQESLAARGYAVVLENVRGRYGSEGFFDPLRQGFDDAEDTLRWIEKQPWSNGRAGMFGGSYSGLAQWKAAATGAPSLKAIFPVHSGIDDYFDRYYSRSGAFRLGHRILWLAQNLRTPGFSDPGFERYVQHVPLRTMDVAATGQPLSLLSRVLDHPAYDQFWKDMSTARRLDPAASPPVFLVSGWYDPNCEGDLEWFSKLAAAGGTHRIAVGAWAHNMSTPLGVDFGPGSRYPVLQAQHAWFDRFVKGEGALPPSGPVSLFVMGVNQWRDEKEWPLKRAVATRLFLAPGRQLRRTAGRAESREVWTYDPRQPTPTQGGATCCDPKVFPWGPKDQRAVEQRSDVLTFLTPVLARDVEVTGPIRAELTVETSAPDTDFTVKLVDVFPDGESRNLCDGILRLRYRNGFEVPALARPGEPYTVTIDAGVTSNVFRAGHRIGVEIASSNFPKYDRNPNTGRPIADEREFRIARQTLWLGGKRASSVILPVVPGLAKDPFAAARPATSTRVKVEGAGAVAKW